MALDLTGLSKYTDELSIELVTEVILKGRTANYVRVQPGVKYKSAINILEGDIVLQTQACGWNPSGSTKPVQRDIEVCALEHKESLCPKDLNDYWAGQLLNAGSNNEEIPFEEAYVNLKTSKLSSINDDLIWKGDTDITGSTNLNKCDGFIKLFESLSGTIIDGNTGGFSAFTKANAIDVVEDFISNISSEIIDRDDLVLFIGYDKFRVYAAALRDANLFHYNGAENQAGSFEMMIPGTMIKMVALKGLNGTDVLVSSFGDNFVIGTDLEGEEDDFRIWYSKDSQEVRTKVSYKLGVQVVFPSLITYAEY